jgi:hypothetical protein
MVGRKRGGQGRKKKKEMNEYSRPSGEDQTHAKNKPQ